MTYKKQVTMLHLSMFVMIIIITFFVFYRAMVHLRGQIDEIKISAVFQVKQIGKDYDLLLESNEELLANDLREKLTELSSKMNLKTKNSDIWNLAEEMELDLILVADMKGNILGSTEPNLKDISIASRIPEYASFVNEPSNQKRIITDRVGLLFNTGKLYKAAWLIDPAKDKVCIVATDFRKYLENTRSASYSDYLLGGYFNSVTRNVMLVDDISLYYEQGAKIFTDTGEENLEMEDLTENAYETVESQVIDNMQSIVIPYTLSGMSEFNRLWLKIRFDGEKIKEVSMNLLLRTLFSFVILVLVIYFAIYMFFKNLLDERDKLIIKVINSLKKDEFDEKVLERDVFSKEIEMGILDLSHRFVEKYKHFGTLAEEKETIIARLHLQLENEQQKQLSLQKHLILAQQTCDQMQRYDKITGLPNRDTMRDYLYYERERAERDKKGYCLVMLKIANFPELINQYGEDFGNYLLNKAGAQMRALLRKQDQIGRWANAEYLLLLPLTNSEGIRLVIARVEQMLADTEFFWQESTIYLSILCGGSVYKTGMSADESLKQVQLALVEAVNTGRDAIIG